MKTKNQIKRTLSQPEAIDQINNILDANSNINRSKLAHKTAERQRRALAINMVIEWRIMLMALLGRDTPELPPEVLFSDLEIKVLKAYAEKKT